MPGPPVYDKVNLWLLPLSLYCSCTGVSSMTLPTEQVPVKQDNLTSHPHSGTVLRPFFYKKIVLQ